MNKRKNAFNVALILSLVVSSNAFGMSLQGIGANAPEVQKTMLFNGVMSKAKTSIDTLKNCVISGYEWAKQLVLNHPVIATTIGATVAGGIITFGVANEIQKRKKVAPKPPVDVPELPADGPELPAGFVRIEDRVSGPALPAGFVRIEDRVFDHFEQKEQPVVEEIKEKKEKKETVTETTKVCTKDSCKPCEDKKDCKTCNKSKGCTSCVAKVVAIQVVSQNSLNDRAFNKARLLALKK